MSTAILGRFAHSRASSSFVAFVPSSFSSCARRPRPGGDMHIPLEFSTRNLPFAISSTGGVILASADTNTAMSLRPLRCSGRWVSSGHGGM